MYIAFEEVGVEIQKHAVLVEKNKKLLLHVRPNYYYYYTSFKNRYICAIYVIHIMYSQNELQKIVHNL